MAIEIYMKFIDPQIVGDTTAKGHEKEFHLYSLGFGAVAPFVAGGGGAGSGKTTLSPITVTLGAYNGPRLLSALDLGTAAKVDFKTYKTASQGQLVLYETITLEGARITRFQESVNGGEDRPMLELAFAYTQIKYTQNGINFTFTH